MTHHARLQSATHAKRPESSTAKKGTNFLSTSAYQISKPIARKPSTPSHQGPATTLNKTQPVQKLQINIPSTGGSPNYNSTLSKKPASTVRKSTGSRPKSFNSSKVILSPQKVADPTKKHSIITPSASSKLPVPRSVKVIPCPDLTVINTQQYAYSKLVEISRQLRLQQSAKAPFKFENLLEKLEVELCCVVQDKVYVVRIKSGVSSMVDDKIYAKIIKVL